MRKPNIGRHAGAVVNRVTFSQAYAHLLAHATTIYQTAGDQTPFTAWATVASKGKHKIENVIRFAPNEEYAFECCWGHITSCYGRYIYCYTDAI
jgi:hypothetical protein